MRQDQTEDRLAVYRDYLNLLVEPLGERDTYVHRENHPGGAHPDWLWRLVRDQGYPWKKGDFAPAPGAARADQQTSSSPSLESIPR